MVQERLASSGSRGQRLALQDLKCLQSTGFFEGRLVIRVTTFLISLAEVIAVGPDPELFFIDAGEGGKSRRAGKTGHAN